MKVIYNQAVDTLTIIFTETLIAESDEDKPGVISDYDDKGNLVSLEILDASLYVNEPGKADVEIRNRVELSDISRFNDEINRHDSKQRK